jgi:hypothetical protein
MLRLLEDIKGKAMQATVEKVENGRQHVFTPEYVETPDGMFHYRLRHHIEGQLPEVDEIYQIGSFKSKETGHGEAISYAYRYIEEHDFGL